MLSTTTAIIHWDEPEEPNGQVVGYRVYYTSNNMLPVNQVWTQLVQFVFLLLIESHVILILSPSVCIELVCWDSLARRVLMLHSGRSRWCAAPISSPSRV